MIGRPRTIQPGAFLDGALWDAEQGTGLPLFRAFLGLWCQADREGRFEWKPRELKVVVLPYWAGDFGDVLSALAAHGFLEAYQVDGRQHGLIRNFKKHQAINPKEPESKLPPPPKRPQSTRDARVPNAESGGNQANPEGFSPTPPLPNLSLLGSGSGALLRSAVSSEDLTGSAREDESDDSEQSEKKSPFESPEERDVFEYWATKLWPLVHPGDRHARATRVRLSKIRARLRDGRPVSELRRVIDAVAGSPFHLGENDTGKAYIEPKTIFRNDEAVDEWLAKKAPTEKRATMTEHDRVMTQRDEALLAEIRAGVWGEKPREVAEQRPIDLRRFREAIDAGKVRRVRSDTQTHVARRTGETGTIAGALAALAQRRP